MVVALFNRCRADRLHRQAQACSRAGDEDAALALYAKCVALDPDYASAFYNIGLIHKYRGEWEKSFAFNARAYELSPGDQASRWNLAIAATALRRWSVARRAWRDNGLNVPDGEGPITMELGMTPVRLHPEGAANGVRFTLRESRSRSGASSRLIKFVRRPARQLGLATIWLCRPRPPFCCSTMRPRLHGAFGAVSVGVDLRVARYGRPANYVL